MSLGIRRALRAFKEDPDDLYIMIAGDQIEIRLSRDGKSILSALSGAVDGPSESWRCEEYALALIKRTTGEI